MMRLAMRDQPAKSLATWPLPPPESGVALLGEFTRHASHLVDMLEPASSLEWAPQGVLRRIHPLAGKEAAWDWTCWPTPTSAMRL